MPRSRMLSVLASLAVVVCHGVALAGDDLYKAMRGPCEVAKVDADWKDDARHREVPVRIYAPKAKKDGAAERLPLVVFSHGLGGSRNGHSYIAEHLASQGYIVILPTHAGSDTEAVRKDVRNRILRGDDNEPGERRTNQGPAGFLAENTSDPDNLKNRPLDISFVIDHALADPEWSARIDAARIGVAGHSFGEYTAMAVGGMLVDLPRDVDHSFREKRVKAVLPMSPQGAGAMGVNAGAWEKVDVPVLFLTGTKDYGQGERVAAWRREAFEAVQGVDDYLIVINEATHMTFADNARARLRPNAAVSPEHAEHIKLVKAATTAFFDSYLQDDPKAKEWLKAYFAEKHTECTAEFKSGEPVPAGAAKR